MLRRAKDMEQELRSSMRGGKGNVAISHILKEGLPEKCRLFARIRLEKGCSIGFHEHKGETEMFYFLTGTGQVDDNCEVYNVSSGDALSTGSGFSHSVENTGESPLEFIAVIILD